MKISAQTTLLVAGSLILLHAISFAAGCVYQFPLDDSESTNPETDTDSLSDVDSDTNAVPEDSTSPVPGEGGALTISAVTGNSLTITWTKATDDSTPRENLEYKVIRSLNPDISTSSDAAAATVVQDWQKDIDTITVTSLVPSTSYYFNVIVRDLSENMAAYQMSVQTTAGKLDGPVAFFPFSSSLEDEGPHKIYLSTTHTPNYADNRVDSADSSLYLNATVGDYLFNGDHPSPLGIENELTVSVWVKLENPAVDQKVIGRALNDGNYWGWVLGVNGSRLITEIWDSNGTKYSLSVGEIVSGVWTHLAMTWETGGKLRGYIDGIMVNEVDASPNPIANKAGSQLRIGCRPWSFPNFFVGGNIDDIRIYNFELTATEIMSLKNLPAD